MRSSALKSGWSYSTSREELITSSVCLLPRSSAPWYASTDGPTPVLVGRTKVWVDRPAITW